MAPKRRAERKGLYGDLAAGDLAIVALKLFRRRRADGNRPRADATHHHAFEHGLTTYRRIAPARSHALSLLGRGGALAAAGDATLEALDAPAGVDQLLAPRIERVAVRADLDAQLWLGGAGLEFVAARAAH